MNTNQAIPTKPVLPKEYANFVGISVPTVRSLARRRLIAALVTPSGQIRVLPEAFREALAARFSPAESA